MARTCARRGRGVAPERPRLWQCSTRPWQGWWQGRGGGVVGVWERSTRPWQGWWQARGGGVAGVWPRAWQGCGSSFSFAFCGAHPFEGEPAVEVLPRAGAIGPRQGGAGGCSEALDVGGHVALGHVDLQGGGHGVT